MLTGFRGDRAFTQVAADRQFAQLGLALIGVLAQVEAAMAPFVESEPDTDSADELEPAHAVGAKVDVSVASGGLDPPPSLGDDLGVAISRDELNDDDFPSIGDRPVPPLGPPSRKEEKRAITPRPAKAKAEGGSTSKRKDTEPQRTGPKGEKKVKKKKKKGGDEFDDLFSTLL